MKKFLALSILLLLTVTGCSTLDAIQAQNRRNLSRLSIGMSKEKVIKIMGDNIIYAKKGLVINNPYRSEILEGKDKIFEVLYYYTEQKKAEGTVTNDELTPIVLEKDKLAGWGWNFLETNAKNYGITLK